jgi:hypothetical protein
MRFLQPFEKRLRYRTFERIEGRESVVASQIRQCREQRSAKLAKFLGCILIIKLRIELSVCNVKGLDKHIHLLGLEESFLEGFVCEIARCGGDKSKKVLDVRIVVRTGCELEESSDCIRVCEICLAVLRDKKSQDLAEVCD